jgi:D-amino peptidase
MRSILLVGLIGSFARAQETRPSGPRVLLYYDMEGISQVFEPRQVFYPTEEYQRSRAHLTSDVNAAIRGFFAGGAASVTVTDAHGSGNPDPDILLDRMDPRAKFDWRDRSFDVYLEGPGPDFDAVAAVGMHPGAGTEGFLAHTYTTYCMLLSEGKPVNESLFVARSAARYGQPLILVTGDDVLEKEVERDLPGTVFARVKRAVSRGKAEGPACEETAKVIEAAAAAAAKKWREIGPYRAPERQRWQIRLSEKDEMDLAANYPGATRIDAKGADIGERTFAEAYDVFKKFVRFASSVVNQQFLRRQREPGVTHEDAWLEFRIRKFVTATFEAESGTGSAPESRRKWQGVR